MPYDQQALTDATALITHSVAEERTELVLLARELIDGGKAEQTIVALTVYAADVLDTMARMQRTDLSPEEAGALPVEEVRPVTLETLQVFALKIARDLEDEG